MNPEQEHIEQQNHVVNPEMLEPTSLRQVEHMGGITKEKQAEIMNPTPTVEAPHIKEEKVAEIKKSIFTQFKERIFGNKETNLADEVFDDIKSLNITKTFDAGLGGLGNMSTNAIQQYEKMISKYNLDEQGIGAFEKIRALSSEVASMVPGAEKVAKTEELNSAKFAFFDSMKKAAGK